MKYVLTSRPRRPAFPFAPDGPNNPLNNTIMFTVKQKTYFYYQTKFILNHNPLIWEIKQYQKIHIRSGAKLEGGWGMGGGMGGVWHPQNTNHLDW
jgi:hypothetical protein